MCHFKVMSALVLGVSLFFVSSLLNATPISCSKPRCCCCHYYHHHHFPHLYLDLGVGKTYDYARSNSVLFNAQPYTDLGNFKTNTSYSSPFFFIGLGYQWSQDYKWFPHLNVGLQHRYTAPVIVSGEADVFARTFSYNYRLQQESWLVMTKADIYKWKRFMPFVTAGIGASFNRISQFFLNTPDFNGQLSAPKTLTSDFSYSVGAGIDFIVKDDFWLSLGYFFDDFGNNKIDNITGSRLSDPLGLRNANLNANSFYLKARYLFA